MSSAANQLAFPQLLKFWRNTFGYSQEALSLAIGVSTRHISFLETGRSSPSRQMLLDIAAEFTLSGRDTNNLLVAAHYLPMDSASIQRAEHENQYQDKALDLTLRSLSHVPACISDSRGNIIKVNRAWVYFHHYWNTDFCRDQCDNLYLLYLSKHGLKHHLRDWIDVAAALILTLQQEIILTNDRAAAKILDEILSDPDIPQDWPVRAARIPYNHSFKMDLMLAKSQIETYISINNTVGATPYVAQPRLLLSCLHRVDAVFQPDANIYDRLQHRLLIDA